MPAELKSDFSLLSEEATENPAFPAFVQAMKGHAYGQKELVGAWSWFRDGFAAGLADAYQIARRSVASGASASAPANIDAHWRAVFKGRA